MIIDDRIKDEKLQYDINREAAKNQLYHPEKLININILQVKKYYRDQSRIIKQAKFTYSPLGKAFEKQIKTIEDQGEKQIKALKGHGKQLVKYGDEKESSTNSKQKGISEEIGSNRMEEIQDLSKQTDFDHLTFRYKGKTAPKNFIAFKGLSGLYKNIKEGYTTLGKAEEERKKIKLELNKIVKGSKKSENQKVQ